MPDASSTIPAVAPQRPLRHPAVRRVLISNTVSGLGSAMTALALPWFVLITTGSATRMGVVYAAEVLPAAVLGIPSGMLVRWLGTRRILVTGDAVLAVLASLIPTLHVLGLLSFWLLLVIAAASGAVATPYFAAQVVLLPEVLGDDEATVTVANALVEGTTWGVLFAGPAVAGFLIAILGPLNVIWVDAASFIFSAAFLLGLPKPSVKRSEESGGPAEASSNVFAGVRFAFKDPLLREIMLAVTGYGLLLPLLLMSLPLLAAQRYDANPHTAGWLLACWGGGALAGTICLPPLARRLSALTLLAIGATGLMVPIWFLPLREPAMAVAIIMAISGLFTPMINAPVFTFLTTRPPVYLRAQVMTFLITASSLARPLSYALGGIMFSQFGIGHVQLGVAVGYTACAAIVISMLRHRSSSTSLAP